MKKEFWLQKWDEGKIGFHLSHINKKLLDYFPKLKSKPKEKILVPLCGKSKDLLWLKENGLEVFGVEFSKKAILDFFEENKLSYTQKIESGFENYHSENLHVMCGDFLNLVKSGEYDYVYDRAALVALPSEMRKTYAQVIKSSLKKGGRYLLISFIYDETERSGPPFNVNENEVRLLYQDSFEIELKETDPSSKDGLIQQVYFLTKK